MQNTISDFVCPECCGFKNENAEACKICEPKLIKRQEEIEKIKAEINRLKKNLPKQVANIDYDKLLKKAEKSN